MSFADRDAVGGDDIGEQLLRLLLPQGRRERREPAHVIDLDPEPTLPFRIEQILVGLGKLVSFHLVGVVRADVHIQREAYPCLMHGAGLRQQVLEIRRLYFLQQIFAIRRLVFRRVVLHDIDVEPPTLCLRRDLLQHTLRAGAPGFHLDPVLGRKRGNDGRQAGVHVIHRHLAAFFLGCGKQQFLAVRSLVNGHLGYGKLALGRVGGDYLRRGDTQRNRCGKQGNQLRFHRTLVVVEYRSCGLA